MAKHQHLTPHQKGIVKRYYDNKGTLMRQKLSEAVSELYVCDNEKKAGRLWKSVGTALMNAGVGKHYTDKIVKNRDLEELAKAVGKLF